MSFSYAEEFDDLEMELCKFIRTLDLSEFTPLLVDNFLDDKRDIDSFKVIVTDNGRSDGNLTLGRASVGINILGPRSDNRYRQTKALAEAVKKPLREAWRGVEMIAATKSAIGPMRVPNDSRPEMIMMFGFNVVSE